MEKITGDADGIVQLKELVKANHEFFRFLLDEARTNVDHVAPFAGPDGVKYLLRVHLATGALEVVRAA